MLTEIHETGLKEACPRVVGLMLANFADANPWDDEIAVLDVGLGHPTRAFAWSGKYGVEDLVAALTESIWFDYGGTPTEYLPFCTRVTPAMALQVAQDFMRSDGQLSSSLRWENEPF
jgi:hypothetical protein